MAKQDKSPIVVQVLTLDHLIEGTASPETSLIFPFPNRELWNPILLTSVRIKATGPDNIPEQSAATFEAGGNGVIAIIPRTDVTQMDNYANWKIWNQPRAGLFHVGPYLMQGKLMSRGNTIQAALPMVEVHITHVSPKSSLGNLDAPFILVNTNWISGYIPA